VVLMNALPFLFIPIYTYALSPSEYGVLELLNRSQEFLLLIISLGLRSSLLTLYQMEAGHRERQQRIYSTALLFLMFFAFVLLLPAVFSSAKVAKLLFFDAGYTRSTLLLLCATYFETLFQMAVLYLQSNLKSTFYVMTFTCRTLLSIGLTALFVYKFHWGLDGVLAAMVAQTAIAGLIVLGYMFTQTGLGFDRTLLREMLHFGVPLLPGAFVMFFLNNGDRYFLNSYGSRDQLGIYGLAYRLGVVTMTLVLLPFGKVWSVTMVTIAKAENGSHRLGTVGTYLIMGCGFSTLGVSLFAPALLHYVAPPLYWPAAALVPVIGAAYVFYCYTVIMDASFYLTKKTKYKSIILLLSCSVILPLYALLIPRWGMWGAAWATLGGFGAFALITGIFAQRIYPIHHEWLRLAKIAALTTALFAAGMAVPANQLGWGVAYRALVVIAYPVLLWTNIFSTPEERAEVKRLWHSTIAKLRGARAVPVSA
jgi:O-antigen/teichoic acid export membrane protein